MTAPVSSDLAWLADLERAHAAATPDEWFAVGLGLYAAGPGHPTVATEVGSADAALIVAAVNAAPTLIAELRKRDAALRAVEAEHQPLTNTNPRQPACPECLGGINADEPDDARSCGCWGLSTPVCSSCADLHDGRRFALQWPCPTVQALAAALSPESVTS